MYTPYILRAAGLPPLRRRRYNTARRDHLAFPGFSFAYIIQRGPRRRTTPTTSLASARFVTKFRHASSCPGLGHLVSATLSIGTYSSSLGTHTETHGAREREGLRGRKREKPRLVPADPLVNLLMFDEMCLLSESLAADVTPERLLARVRSQVYLDVALVEETAVADGTPVNRLLLAANQARFRSVGERGRPRARALLRRVLRARGWPRPLSRVRGRREGRVQQVIGAAGGGDSAGRADGWIGARRRWCLAAGRVLEAGVRRL